MLNGSKGSDDLLMCMDAIDAAASADEGSMCWVPFAQLPDPATDGELFDRPDIRRVGTIGCVRVYACG